MGLLQVDPTGLHVLAGRCESLAGEVGANSVVQASLPSGQATAAAVHAVHAGVAAAGAAMTARLTTTSTKLASAATAFTEQEATSAGNLAALSPPSGM